MSISDERIEQIMSFADEFDPDCPPLTERQLSQLRPSHLVNRELWRPQKKVLNIRIDADLLDSTVSRSSPAKNAPPAREAGGRGKKDSHRVSAAA